MLTSGRDLRWLNNAVQGPAWCTNERRKRSY